MGVIILVVVMMCFDVVRDVVKVGFAFFGFCANLAKTFVFQKVGP